MKTSTLLATFCAVSHAAGHMISHDTASDDVLAVRSSSPESHISPDSSDSVTSSSLEKRRGGGGRGGGGGGGTSSGSGGRSGSGSSGSRPNQGAGSNTGGSSPGGSGTRPSFGGAGGNVYAGGARAPYQAGAARGGISPYILPAAALGGLAFFPAAFLASAYFYPYPGRYGYYNQTAGRNESAPVTCLCGQGSECGCEPNNDTSYLNSLVGNGSDAALAQNGVARASNGTLYINGTLDNGTTSDDGTDAGSPAGGSMKLLLEQSGWWAMVAVVGATVWTV